MISFASKSTVAQVTAMASVVLLSAFFPTTGSAVVTEKPNILWVWVDDQHPWYATYGHTLVHTPNIDKLADTGVLLDRAFV